MVPGETNVIINYIRKDSTFSGEKTDMCLDVIP